MAFQNGLWMRLAAEAGAEADWPELHLSDLTVPLAFGTFVFCYVYFCILRKGPASPNKRFVEKCRNAGTYTTGRVHSYKRRRGVRRSTNSNERADKFYVKYEYEVDGIRYYKTLRFLAKGTVWADYPDEITIYYKGSNPRRSAANEGENGTILIGFLLTGFFTVVSMFLGYWLFGPIQ